MKFNKRESNNRPVRSQEQLFIERLNSDLDEFLRDCSFNEDFPVDMRPAPLKKSTFFNRVSSRRYVGACLGALILCVVGVTFFNRQDNVLLEPDNDRLIVKNGGNELPLENQNVAEEGRRNVISIVDEDKGVGLDISKSLGVLANDINVNEIVETSYEKIAEFRDFCESDLIVPVSLKNLSSSFASVPESNLSAEDSEDDAGDESWISAVCWKDSVLRFEPMLWALETAYR